MGWRVRLALLLCVVLLWAAGLAAAGECGATAFLRHGGLGPARPALPRAQRCRDGCEVGAPRVSAGIRGMRGCPGFSFVPCVSLHKERVFSWNCLLRARGSVGWVLLWISRSAFCVRFFSDKPNAFRSRHTVSLNVLQTKAL